MEQEKSKQEKSFVSLNGVAYEMTPALVDEIENEIKSAGWSKNDVTKDIMLDAIKRVLLRKQKTVG